MVGGQINDFSLKMTIPPPLSTSLGARGAEWNCRASKSLAKRRVDNYQICPKRKKTTIESMSDGSAAFILCSTEMKAMMLLTTMYKVIDQASIRVAFFLTHCPRE